MPFNRRTFITTATAGLAALTSVRARAATAAPEMLSRATAALATLSAAQQQTALFEFNDPLRAGWNYMLGSRRAPGLALEDMDPAQKEAALALLATALSAEGFEKAQNIMLQQDILRDEWRKGSPDRNRERFSLMIFGTPQPGSAWGWRWEGHHLSISITLIGDQILSATPNAFASEPNTVPSGPHKGLVVLKEEEVLGRQLYTDLSSSARSTALVNDESPGNVLTLQGREGRYDGDTRGLPLSDMTQSQRDMALRLIEVYTAEPFAAAIAEPRRARLQAGDLEATRFIWAGADLDRGPIYYRLHGPDLLIEFASLRNQPLHLHTASHEPGHNLGAAGL
ncbi:MAG: DUF3500 domain-containing protein [Pseudomonadota bacterium]